MASEILINVRPAETRVAFLDQGVLADFMAESNRKQGMAGSIFRGRVNRVLPGMQAAFVDVGLDRAAFLYVGDVRSEASSDSVVFGDDGEPSRDGAERDEASRQNEPEPPKVPIQDLLSEGQDLIVQVAKDPLGTKGARITTHISLPGRYVVYMPTVNHLGISRRIEDPTERERLRGIVEKIRPSRGGLIVRTAGEGATEESLKADIEYLVLLSEDISKSYQKKKTVGLIHRELPMELRAIRDLLTEEVDRITVDDAEAQKKVMKFINQFMPKLKTKVELYEGTQPLFDKFDVDLEISRSLGRKVWLKSGGYIIIDEAEALVVIDVNTGSYVGKKDLEDTILKTNLEAVREIAHQLRIRNCGGIIIIDFIDMEREANREKVLSALKEELKKDRARTNVSSMSALGLVEMTRKRIRPSLVRTMCEPCDYCDGKGYVKTKETVAFEIFREIERESRKASVKSTIVNCHPDVASWIYDEESEMLEFLERKHTVQVTFKTQAEYHIEQYEIFTAEGYERGL
jgi:ribonuclease G